MSHIRAPSFFILVTCIYWGLVSYISGFGQSSETKTKLDVVSIDRFARLKKCFWL